MEIRNFENLLYRGSKVRISTARRKDCIAQVVAANHLTVHVQVLMNGLDVFNDETPTIYGDFIVERKEIVELTSLNEE